MLLDFVQPGDTLVVTRIDCLARSMKDLQDIIHELEGRGVALRAAEQHADTGTAAIDTLPSLRCTIGKSRSIPKFRLLSLKVWTYPQSCDPNRKTGLIVGLDRDAAHRGDAGRRHESTE